MEDGENGPHGQHVNTTVGNTGLGDVCNHTQQMEAKIVWEIAVKIWSVMLENVEVQIPKLYQF